MSDSGKVDETVIPVLDTNASHITVAQGSGMSNTDAFVTERCKKLHNKREDTDSDSSIDNDAPAHKKCYHKVTYVPPVNINALNHKYNGTTCILSYLERLDELIISRSLTYNKVFRSAAELFTDVALVWYRSIRDSVSSWEELKQELLDEFLPPDFDYHLLEELKARTQGINESFSIYFSVMLNFFNRLRTPLSEEEKLRILRRNIRPAFSDRLALFPITSLQDFKNKCKELERQNIRSQYFVEPPKVTKQTLAADLAYKSGHAGTHQVAATALTTQPASAAFCLRCRVKGHNLKTCTAPPHLVCFRCGLKGYITKNCPNCNKMGGDRGEKSKSCHCQDANISPPTTKSGNTKN